ncbi:hypothetical protein KIP45_05125 [Xanthomonas campestris pv. raphani]|uniref:phospholipase D family protein n=1 Tax=Xanthomonas campestris TaxID=339 RepID=UPI001F360EA8|nr:phospholipase D family protein [Xanthomonas campestris]MCF8825480.1 hypothetical protein [Xanthomonas campestris pv. raphani]MEA9931477.1 phospholipase D-like domain-containing protein [Xanthomonas campestris pv. raphani]
MKLVGQPLAGMLLRNAHSQSIEHCTRVVAAVAYSTFDQKWWFEDCLIKGKSLEFFGGYDGTVPIDPRLLEWALNPRLSANLSWRVVPTHLHAKVIWWEGQGVYIGSANMTERAWNNNFEAGVFLPDDMLESFGLVPQLLTYFEGLRRHSEPLRQEHLDAQKALEKRRDQIMAAVLRLERGFDANDPTVKHALNPLAFESKRPPKCCLPAVPRGVERDPADSCARLRGSCHCRRTGQTGLPATCREAFRRTSSCMPITTGECEQAGKKTPTSRSTTVTAATGSGRWPML